MISIFLKSAELFTFTYHSWFLFLIYLIMVGKEACRDYKTLGYELSAKVKRNSILVPTSLPNNPIIWPITYYVSEVILVSLDLKMYMIRLMYGTFYFIFWWIISICSWSFLIPPVSPRPGISINLIAFFILPCFGIP